MPPLRNRVQKQNEGDVDDERNGDEQVLVLEIGSEDDQENQGRPFYEGVSVVLAGGPEQEERLVKLAELASVLPVKIEVDEPEDDGHESEGQGDVKDFRGVGRLPNSEGEVEEAGVHEQGNDVEPGLEEGHPLSPPHPDLLVLFVVVALGQQKQEENQEADEVNRHDDVEAVFEVLREADPVDLDQLLVFVQVPREHGEAEDIFQLGQAVHRGGEGPEAEKGEVADGQRLHEQH